MILLGILAIFENIWQIFTQINRETPLKIQNKNNQINFPAIFKKARKSISE